MKYIFLSLAVTTFFACSSPAVKQEEQSHVIDSAIAPPAVETERTRIAETGTDCKRKEPMPIVKKGSFPDERFELQPGRQVGIETFKNQNGEKVTIKNWGCEYIALTFHFETARFEGELSNTGFWYKRTATLLNELSGKLDAPIDIAKGAERIVTEIENDVPNGYQNLKLNKELDFEDSPRSFVSIDKVEKIDSQKFAIEVTFAKGPL